MEDTSAEIGVPSLSVLRKFVGAKGLSGVVIGDALAPTQSGDGGRESAGT